MCTVHLIELNHDNNNKLILVFTVVTVIFLPLSFVTGYLGMNTADIRSMANRQPLFWAIALPLTFTILAIALLVGLQGQCLYQRLRTYLSGPWLGKKLVAAATNNRKWKGRWRSEKAE
ncbi:hypothetical protein GP486_006801 [Trichoglossum hirsutum]|uniref:Uncharacterized protein n=1 Tax=Trichoglossum hirsutum TaxID=265104 RepID=A0A9P8L3C9_9PEZI|nr:hypothetical protein GP486_006801 [Trichoglossum hirsutum]